MGSAFQHDEAVRQAALARLQAAAQAGRLQGGHVAWTADKCSVVGALIGTDALPAWEDQLGLPAWLALVLEAAAGGRREITTVVETAAVLLNAIALGADLERQGSALIVALLDDVARALAPAGLPRALQQALAQVTALHGRSVAGEVVAPAEWKAARRHATGLTDTLAAPAGDQRHRAVARCVESAAWDPQRSRTAVLDTLRQWSEAYREKSMLDYGWTAASDARVQAQLDSLHARYVADAAEPKPNVFTLYEQYHDADAAALRAMLAFQRENHWTIAALPAAFLEQFLSR
jgi:hypothetical protein